MILLASLFGLAFAQTINFYVAPIEVDNKTRYKQIEQEIDKQLAFVNSAGYSKTPKIKNERGVYSPMGLTDIDINLYNDKTIAYISSCDFVQQPLRCSRQEDFYFVETIVTVDDHQLTVRMTMYDPNLQVVNSSISHEDMVITWIKQQEVTNIQQQNRDGSTTNVTHKGLEKLPLKWEVPHFLLAKHIQEAASELWIGAKIDP
tara:strand:+ start:433 stop:1041 length:609 start_codon:yes stop_codon:yes gene_type:complete